jgi:hypothetical protein
MVFKMTKPELSESDLDHPCRDTCSGWKQGFEKGRASVQKAFEDVNEKLIECNRQLAHERRKSEKLLSALEEIKNFGDFGSSAYRELGIYPPQNQMAINAIAEYHAPESHGITKEKVE